MKQMTPEMAVAAARMDLCVLFPFYGSIFLRLNVFEDDTCPTAWTDGVSMGYNVDYLGSLKHTQIIGVFVHECLHVILKHHLRAALDPEKKLNHKIWNYACDYALNPTIKATPGMDIHPNWLYESKWDDELAEVIFQELKRDAKKVKVASGSGDGPGEVRPFPGKNEDGTAKKGTGKDKPTKADIDAAENEVDQWVSAAAFKAQGAGKTPGNMQRIIKRATTSTVSWEDELQMLAEAMTKDDYTWTRPNSNYSHLGVYLPSLADQPRASDMIFFCDTSGSLGQSQLDQIMTEARRILDHFNIRVIIIYWDTHFRGVEIFEPEDILDPQWQLNAAGGGGTQFTEMWNWLEQNLDEYDIDPEGIIVFSDLECSGYPQSPPDLPVIWAQVPGYHNSFKNSYLSYLPEYGKHVRVPIYREAA